MTHETQDTTPDVAREEPVTPGWYRTAAAAAAWMIYALDERGQWSAHALNGDATPCVWSYIDQAGPIELLAACGVPR